MKNITGSLGFKLTAITYIVVAVFLSVAGFTVYRISKDSIQDSAREMVKDMADKVQLELMMKRSVEELGDVIAMVKISKTGSSWIMDKEGYMLYLLLSWCQTYPLKVHQVRAY